ncbi:MAG TPA: glycine/sarcosine/betaine reductase selenoprotein B family protein [Thermoanaerobaculia bacterium]|nr:glycine/sarcosine/betaine reductase selenoprotein B family protein [Thermoanaerobaculia bacterium]
MGDLSEFNLSTRLFLKAYPWRRLEPTPWTPLKKPLAQSRIALVSSAGFVEHGDAPFDPKIKGGDCSFRFIHDDCDLSLLQESHRSETFDHRPMREDPNLALPIDRMHELVATGRIGSVNHRHLSFMGSITAPGRLVTGTAPTAAASLIEDSVDVALLVPV